MPKLFHEVIRNMDFFDYLRRPGLNATTAKSVIATSWEHTRIKPDSDKAEKLLGRCCHGMLLDAEAFAASYAILPGTEGILTEKGKPSTKPKSTAMYEKRIEDFKATLPPETNCVEPEVHVNATKIVEAVRNSTEAMEKLDGCETELSLFWEHPAEHGTIMCKSRLDAIHIDKKIIVELKTTHTAHPTWFIKEIKRWGYQYQMAFQGMASSACLGILPRKYYIIAVETAPPFAVTIVEIMLPTIAECQAKCIEIMDQYSGLPKTGPWPTYGNEIVQVDLSEGE